MPPGVRLRRPHWPSRWTTAQAEISADWLRELLRREGLRWERIRDSVRHRAGPVLEQADRAQREDVRPYGRPHMRETAI